MSEDNPLNPPRRRTSEPALKAKLAFLRRAESYPGAPAEVQAIETHMSWVFLAATHAYKMKKPIRLGAIDFRRGFGVELAAVFEHFDHFI